MSELVAKLRDPNRWSSDDSLAAADLIESQAKELAACQTRIELLEHDMKSGDFESLYAHTVFELEAAQARVVVLTNGINAVSTLINESEGVAGLHLNGDIASWDSLQTGGRFEDWLLDFDKALTDTADIVQKVREKRYEECAVICEKKALVLYGGYEPTTEYAKGIERGLEKGAEAIRAAIGETP